MSKFARILVVLAAAYMAFMLVWDGAQYPNLGVDYELYGQGPRPTELAGKPWPAAMMQQWSRQFDVDVVVSGSPKEPGVIAGFSAPQDSEFRSWLNDGYPCLRKPCVAKPLDLTQHPEAIQDFEVDVAGLYFMGKNSAGAVAAAQEYFANMGWDTGYQDHDSLTVWLELFRALFLRLFLVVMLLTFLLCSGSVLTRSRASGVLMLQGASRWQLVLVDVLTWTQQVIVGSLLAALAITVGFFMAFGGHQLGRVLLAFGPLCLCFYLIGVAGIAAAHQVLRLTSIIEAIKGRVRFGLTFPIVYVIRSFVIISAATLLLTLGSSAATLRSELAIRQDPGPFGALSTFDFNGGTEDNPQRLIGAAREVSTMLAERRLVLTQARPAYYYDTSSTLTDQLGSGQDRLVIEASAGYLGLQSVKLSTGRDLDPKTDLSDSSMNLLVPEGSDPSLVEHFRRYIRSMFSIGGFGTIPDMKGGIASVNVVRLARSGNTLMTYGDSVVTADNPVMIVYPVRFTAGTDFVTSQQGLFVRTRDVADVLKSAPNFAALTVGTPSVDQTMNETVNATQADISRGLVELLGFLMILPLSTVAVAFLYARQHAQRIFVQTAFGHSVAAIAPLLLVLDAITIAATCWYTFPRTATLSELHSFGTNALAAPKVQFALSLAVLALVVGVQYLVFKRLQWGIVRRRAGEE